VQLRAAFNTKDTSLVIPDQVLAGTSAFVITIAAIPADITYVPFLQKGAWFSVVTAVFER